MEKNYLYTLAFLQRKDEILMLNRAKAPWFGMWNGVGGKREPGESPEECIRREIAEETGIELDAAAILFRGTLSWNDDFIAASKGLYLFFAILPDHFVYPTPTSRPEGILEWKKIGWIMDSRNLGVAYNIPHFLPTLIKEARAYHYDCAFAGTRLVSVNATLLSN